MPPAGMRCAAAVPVGRFSPRAPNRMRAEHPANALITVFRLLHPDYTASAGLLTYLYLFILLKR